MSKLLGSLKDLSLLKEGVSRGYAEVRGVLNPNHRHDEPHEKRSDQIRAATRASHRFGSFAGETQRNTVKWYIDGHDYFWAVSEILDAAKETIYIMDWWLSPELYLRRPPADFPEWRLDRLLQRKAEQGVKIYVIVYKEVTQTMKCRRGTQRMPSKSCTPTWLCYVTLIILAQIRPLNSGRIMKSPLADAHPTDFSRTLFPGQDYNNARVLDFQQVDNYVSNVVSILDTPRMPWHDVHMSLVGDAVEDVCQHFVERWNEIKNRKYKKDAHYDWLLLPRELKAPEEDGQPAHPHRGAFDAVGQKFRDKWHDAVGDNRPPRGHDDQQRGQPSSEDVNRTTGTCNVQVCRSVSDWSHGVLIEKSIQNAYLQLINEANHFIYIENQFFISNATDKGPVQNKIAQALTQRILTAARAGTKFKVIVVIPEVPGFSGDIQQQSGIKTIMAAQWRTINRGGSSIYEQIRNAGFEPLDYIRFYHLRAFDRINAPGSFIRRIEQNSGVTFHEAQVALARTWIGDDGYWVQSKVKIKEPDLNTLAGESTLDEANLGMTEKKKATATVQEVDFPPTTALAHEIVQRFESGGQGLRSDDSVSDSIAQHMLQDTTDLRTEAWLGTEQEERDCIVSELLYIHSKLMIVDDKRVIMGSANINDRSQKGDGDSEIALVVEDTDMIPSTMDGKPYMAGRFAATLRRKLFREHLGLVPPQTCETGKEGVTSFMRPSPIPSDDETHLQEDRTVADPLSDEFLTLWSSTAQRNREVFQEVFRSVPTDTVRNWEQYKKYVPKVKTGHIASDLPLPQIKDKLATVRGALVEAPINFLIEQKELIDNPEWLNPALPVYL